MNHAAPQAVQITSPVAKAISEQREALINLRETVETLANRLAPIRIDKVSGDAGGQVNPVSGRSPLLFEIESGTDQVKHCNDLLANLIDSLQI